MFRSHMIIFLLALRMVLQVPGQSLDYICQNKEEVEVKYNGSALLFLPTDFKEDENSAWKYRKVCLYNEEEIGQCTEIAFIMNGTGHVLDIGPKHRKIPLIKKSTKEEFNSERAHLNSPKESSMQEDNLIPISTEREISEDSWHPKGVLKNPIRNRREKFSVFCPEDEIFSWCAVCEGTCRFPAGDPSCNDACWPGCICFKRNTKPLVRREDNQKCATILECLNETKPAEASRSRRGGVPENGIESRKASSIHKAGLVVNGTESEKKSNSSIIGTVRYFIPKMELIRETLGGHISENLFYIRRAAIRSTTNLQNDESLCKVPTNLVTAEVSCNISLTSKSCKSFCVFGTTFEEGIVRKHSCNDRENQWSKVFEECRQFVNCNLNLRSPGKIKCIGNEIMMNPWCAVACDANGDKNETKRQVHTCLDNGNWQPPLPHCVEPKGAQLVRAPEKRKHDATTYL